MYPKTKDCILLRFPGGPLCDTKMENPKGTEQFLGGMVE